MTERMTQFDTISITSPQLTISEALDSEDEKLSDDEVLLLRFKEIFEIYNIRLPTALEDKIQNVIKLKSRKMLKGSRRDGRMSTFLCRTNAIIVEMGAHLTAKQIYR